MVKLDEYDLKVLRASNGEVFPELHWGAAMGSSIEYLSRQGFMDRTGKITPKGQQYLLDNNL